MFLVQLVLLGSWLARDHSPAAWDPAVHLGTACDYKTALADGSVFRFLHTKSRPGHPPYPPLAHYALLPSFVLARATGLPVEDFAALTNAIYLFLLAWGAWLIADTWWGRRAAYCAAVLVGLFPPALVFSRQVLVDVALAAWVMLTYAAWVKSERFSVRNWTFAAAVFAAFGLLTKWTFPVYVVPVLGSLAMTCWREPAKRPVLRRALALAAIIAAPWYLVNFPTMATRLSRAAGAGTGEGDPAVGSLASWFWYARLIWWQLFWPGAILGAAGLVWAAARKLKGAKTLLLWFFVTYFAWTAVTNKNDRYFFPAMLTLPLAVAALPFGVAATGCAATVAFAGWLTWGPAIRDSRPPDPGPWPLDEIVRTVDGDRNASDAITLITVVANAPSLNANTLKWTIQKLGLDARLYGRTKLERLGQFSEFVLVKTGDLGPAYSIGRQAQAREEALRPGGWFASAFAEHRRWPLGDGSEAILFRRKPADQLTLRPFDASALQSVWPDIQLQDAVAERNGDTARLRARAATWRGLAASGLTLMAAGYEAVEADDKTPRALKLRSVRLDSLVVSEAAIADFLRQRARWLKGPAVSIGADGNIGVSGRAGPLMLRLGIGLRDASDESPALDLEIKSLRIGGVPLPVFLLGKFHVPVRPTPGMPFQLSWSRLGTIPGALVIGEGK